MERYFSKSRLSSNPLDAPGHRALSLLHLPRLRTLYLGYNGLDADGLAALASAPWLTQLAELHIDQFAFGAEPSEHVRRDQGRRRGVWPPAAPRLRCGRPGEYHRPIRQRRAGERPRVGERRRAGAVHCILPTAYCLLPLFLPLYAGPQPFCLSAEPCHVAATTQSPRSLCMVAWAPRSPRLTVTRAAVHWYGRQCEAGRRGTKAFTCAHAWRERF